MQFILTKQIAVEADTPEAAATQEGKTISLKVDPRPQQPRVMHLVPPRATGTEKPDNG